MGRKYFNTTKYNKALHDDKHPFLVVSNELIKDRRLTDEELGLMIRILNNSDGYVFNSTYFQKHVSSQGENRYYKSLKHLQELGYIVKIPKQGGIDWIINEVPIADINDMSTDANDGSRLEDGDSTFPEATNSEIATGKSTTGEITILENEVLNNINRISNNEINNNRSINEEYNTNEIHINELDGGFLNSSDFRNKIENTLSNLKIGTCNVLKEFNKIYQFEEELLSKLPTNIIGKDIVDYSEIEKYVDRINNIWNSSNTTKFEELSNTLTDLTNLFAIRFDTESFIKFSEGNYEVIPQDLLTENNLLLFQLYLYLDFFMYDNGNEIKDFGSNSNKFVENEDTKQESHLNTTKIIDKRTKNPVIQYSSESIIPQEKYDYFNDLINKNKALEKKERNKGLFEILKEFQHYFIEVFGTDIWKLITQDKTVQIRLVKDAGYSWKTIYLYQNTKDLYQQLVNKEISEETLF